MNHITGRSAFLALLKSEGVTHLFGNPGTTELPIMHALVDHPDLTYVMSMHESLVVGMADGYARASGQLGACNVHVTPGLGNAMGSLFNAKFTNTPLILTAGQQELGHGLTEPLLFDNLVRVAEPLVKWAVEVTRLEDLPRIVHRAAKVAMTPPTGPVFISLPGDILNDENAIDLGTMTRVDSRVRPSDELLADIANCILKAKRPIIIVGDEVVRSDAMAEAASLAETIGAPAMQQGFASSGCYLSEHNCYMGLFPKNQPAMRKTLSEHDLMIVLGCDPLRTSVASETDPMPAGLPVLHIGLDDWQIGKNYAVDLPVRADIRETLRALIPLLKQMGGAALQSSANDRMAAFAAGNWSAKRGKLASAILERPAAKPIDPDQLMLHLVETLPRDAMIVHEGFTSTHHLCDLFAFRDRFAYHNGGSGGIGWSLPASIGAAFAQPERPVVTVVGDGSAMFSIQALWTMAHHKLPITTVICNNGGYRIIKQRLKSFLGGNHFVGMDFVDPAVDFVGLARSMGVEAHRITETDQIQPTLSAAIASRRPVLLDVIVDNRV
ncbi:MAG: thiamine pyrophosphate-binding protein [Hyphomicrobiaceae bacterium]